jgi:hypothetical protein
MEPAMCTEKQRLANQRNAEKSTGPKTAEGKSRSRRNAVKHGLSGDEGLLPPKDARLFRERLGSWAAEEQPEGGVEEYVLGCAVLAAVRIDRCARLDFADAARRRRATIDNWQKRHRRRVKSAAKQFDDDPGLAIERLKNSTRGCDWLLDEWDALGEALESQGGWNRDQSAQALRLLAGHPADEADEKGLALILNALATEEEVDLDEVDKFFEVDTSHLDPEERRTAARARLPEPHAARDTLVALVADETVRLESHQATIWREKDAPILSDEINLFSFDVSAEGNLRRRYQSTNALDFHRNLNQLRAHRKAERKGRLNARPVAEADRIDEAVYEGPAESRVEPAPPPPPPVGHEQPRAEERPAVAQQSECGTHFEETAFRGPSGVLDERTTPSNGRLRNEGLSHTVRTRADSFSSIP